MPELRETTEQGRAALDAHPRPQAVPELLGGGAVCGATRRAARALLQDKERSARAPGRPPTGGLKPASCLCIGSASAREKLWSAPAAAPGHRSSGRSGRRPARHRPWRCSAWRRAPCVRAEATVILSLPAAGRRSEESAFPLAFVRFRTSPLRTFVMQSSIAPGPWLTAPAPSTISKEGRTEPAATRCARATRPPPRGNILEPA